MSGGLAHREIAIRNPAIAGRPLGELMAKLPPGLAIIAVRQEQHRVPRAGMILRLDEVFLVPRTIRQPRSRRSAWPSTTCSA